jgi:hemoglobin
MSSSLFQKYGGFAAISRVVLAFYDKVLDSDQIGGFFEDIDMKRLVDHQTKFISMLLGGPATYSDERLGQLHRHLSISDEDFNEVGRLLTETLHEFGFDPADRDAIMREIEARRVHVVTQAQS